MLHAIVASIIFLQMTMLVLKSSLGYSNTYEYTRRTRKNF